MWLAKIHKTHSEDYFLIILITPHASGSAKLASSKGVNELIVGEEVSKIKISKYIFKKIPHKGDTDSLMRIK